MTAPFGTEMPVPAAVLTVCANPVPFFTKYSFVAVGTMTLYDAPGVPVRDTSICRASSVDPFAILKVRSAAVIDTEANPAIEASISAVIPVFTRSPHVLASSPANGRVRRRLGVYELGI
jgi:hypothetical protein